ncbi:MAG: 2-oxoacid:acceptor oxidoreductase subunit alpha [Deltaproteobacteria bacterium]|nr:2-oxoacid:acceptor oxidoreductase subunit alpha [Deltaproteobacteria bacterium]
MSNTDIVLEICGSAGEGTISSGEIFNRYISSIDFEIMSFDTYPSEIRGFGKCVAHSRFSTQKIFTPGKYTDILIALNDAHSISQLGHLKDTGVVIYDSKPPKYHEEDKSIVGWMEPGMISYGIPFNDLAQKAAGNSRGRNMVALGAVCALFGVDHEEFKNIIIQRYAKKKQIVIDNNVNSFVEGYNWANDNLTKIDSISFKKGKNKNEKESIIINGNQAVAKAAIDSELHLYAGYPITPATKIMEILSHELPKKNGIMLQTEDEISAIGNVLGAGFAGKRSMTATSGPGFALMTEFMGLSVMAQIPAVIVNSQRGGPSTGLPTKTEQSDFNAAVNGGTGDLPRFVIAPASVEECYDGTTLAFYLAEKYQTLVVILLDFFLSNSIRNIDEPTPPTEKMLNSNIAPNEKELKDYVRFKETKTGVSPRSIPGTPNGMYTTTGLENNERGKPQYDGKLHTKMSDMRYRKLNSALNDVPKPKWTGPKKDIDVGILSWGSSAGAAYEAATIANKNGHRVAVLSSLVVFPVNEVDLTKFCNESKQILIPELNYSGQYANFIASYINRPVERLNMVSGLPMASEDVLSKIDEMIAS